MQLTPFGISYLHPRPAWAAIWWSIVLPGFGHFYLGHNLRGLVLMAWEAVVNHQAHLNLAIYHAILGQGEEAARILHLDWALLYPFLYLFSIWDAYRLAVEQNKLCRLEEVQTRHTFQRAMLHPITGINFLDKRNPLVAAFWGVLVGGLGHLYNMRLAKALMLTGWQTGVMVLSNFHTALALTLSGQPDQARAVVDYQWLLFLPSVGIFNVISAYTDAVELNNLFDEEWEYRWRKYILNPSYPRGAAGSRPEDP